MQNPSSPSHVHRVIVGNIPGLIMELTNASCMKYVTLKHGMDAEGRHTELSVGL
jgi:hypothetical protein